MESTGRIRTRVSEEYNGKCPENTVSVRGVRSSVSNSMRVSEEQHEGVGRIDLLLVN